MKKRILILSTGDIHGAYEAAYRIAYFLLEVDFEVKLIVRDKSRSDSFIIKAPVPPGKTIIKRIINRALPAKKKDFQTDPKFYFLNFNENEEYTSAESILNQIEFTPDLIIAGLVSGFVSTNTLLALKEKTKAKIFMLAVDMGAFTGGCHYSWDCKGYQNDCRNCPAILELEHKDKAHQNLIVRLDNVKRAGIQIAAMSEWTSNQAQKSTLFKNQKFVPNFNSLIDTRIFNNKHRAYAKKLFDVPDNAKIVFTGSWHTDEKRKGLDYFVAALNFLWEKSNDVLRENVYVLVIGNNTKDNPVLSKVPFKKHYVDFIKDYRLLSLAYQAADIFVCASIEDAGPMMVSEALACGTPVVGFEMGVISNMVINNYNGYKAELKNSHDLAKGLYEILSLSDEVFKRYSYNAVLQVENFSSQKQVIKIIQDILND